MSDETPIGYAACQACDAPAVKASQHEGNPVVLCGYHFALLGKHKTFAEALEARARKEKK